MQNQRDNSIIVYSTTWCPDCHRAKRFLGEQRIPYVNVDIEKDAEAMVYVEQVNNGMRSIPTIVFPDGDILVEPSNAVLAEKLGLQTKARRSFYDAIIIGGGPRTLTARKMGSPLRQLGPTSRRKKDGNHYGSARKGRC